MKTDRRFASVFFSGVLILVLLAPFAQILRTQQPFRCFPLTFDESFYIHAVHFHSKTGELRADWMNKPMEPVLTIGPVFARGIELTHKTLGKWLKLDWTQSGRLYVQLCFLLLLFALSWRVAQRSRSALGVAVFLYFAVSWVQSIPLGGYLVYGILGELPAALLAWLGFLCLRGWKFWASGVFLVGSVLTKPSFLPILPAAFVALFTRSKKRALVVGAVSLALGALALRSILHARHETLAEYFRVFSAQSESVSPHAAISSVFQYFRTQSLFFKIYMAVGLWIAARALFVQSRRRALDPVDRAALNLTFIAIVYYFVLLRMPQPKHVFVLFHSFAFWVAMELGVFAAKRYGHRLEAWIPENMLRSSFFVAVAVWVLHVPSQNLRLFREASTESCPVKQQREIDRKFLELHQSGEPASHFGTLTTPSASHFLFELGFSPYGAQKWEDFQGKIPRWVGGDFPAMEPLPSSCTWEWKGNEMGIAHCGKPKEKIR